MQDMLRAPFILPFHRLGRAACLALRVPIQIVAPVTYVVRQFENKTTK